MTAASALRMRFCVERAALLHSRLGAAGGAAGSGASVARRALGGLSGARSSRVPVGARLQVAQPLAPRGSAAQPASLSVAGLACGQECRRLRAAAGATAGANPSRHWPGGGVCEEGGVDAELASDAAQARPATWVRESGMPPVELWEDLLDPEAALEALGLRPGLHGRLLELGCGYGTFTLAAARRAGEVLTFDIDPAMVELTRERARRASLRNVRAAVRDVVADGYGEEPGSCGGALLFNILHCPEPVAMLHQAAWTLSFGEGRLYAMHWRSDPSTPRGPPMRIRPKPEQLETWALATGLLQTVKGPVDCPPWHYGWVFRRV